LHVRPVTQETGTRNSAAVQTSGALELPYHPHRRPNQQLARLDWRNALDGPSGLRQWDRRLPAQVAGLDLHDASKGQSTRLGPLFGLGLRVLERQVTCLRLRRAQISRLEGYALHPRGPSGDPCPSTSMPDSATVDEAGGAVWADASGAPLNSTPTDDHRPPRTSRRACQRGQIQYLSNAEFVRIQARVDGRKRLQAGAQAGSDDLERVAG
jgi:hypothetical protein